MSLDISKIHKSAILEYIYNKLDEEQLYYPFIDEELEKRIKYLCEDVYEAAYKDGQETEKLEEEENKNKNNYAFIMLEDVLDIDTTTDFYKKLKLLGYY